MEVRLRNIFLVPVVRYCLLALIAIVASANCFAGDENKGTKLRANTELFDIGVFVGVINIEDFPSEYLIGANATFKASEDFFLQYNYLQADIEKSSMEKNPAGPVFDLGDDRLFKHYDLLIGYNILQAEFFASSEKSRLANLYLVAGIGETIFGEEENFTYTLGVGYQVEFQRRFIVRIDFRDYIYESSLIGIEEERVHNTQFSTGLSYLF